MARAIDGDKLLKQLQRKKCGPANKRYTEGFNDCLLRVRSMIHAATRLTPQPGSREYVDKIWRRCEWCNGEHSNNGKIRAYTLVECEGCDIGDDCPNLHSSDDPCYGMVDRALPVNFCPVCGAPMTDEAIQRVMKRLEDIYA